MESLNGRDHFEDLGADRKIIFKWFLKRSVLDSPGLGYRIVAGSCKHGNGFSGSIKDRKFLKQLRDY
jgi:hypothetical protein